MWALVAEDSAVNISDSRRIETCRMNGFTFHDWRHTLEACYWMQCPLAYVSEQMGQASRRSLRRSPSIRYERMLGW